MTIHMAVRNGALKDIRITGKKPSSKGSSPQTGRDQKGFTPAMPCWQVVLNLMVQVGALFLF